MGANLTVSKSINPNKGAESISFSISDFNSGQNIPINSKVTKNLAISSSEVSIVDSAYFSFKPQSKAFFSGGFSSIFWIKRDYSIVMKSNSEKITLKSEFHTNITDEECLNYFKTFDYLKANVLDYTEKIQDDIFLLNLKIKKSLIGQINDYCLAFKVYKSAGVYVVGRGVSNQKHAPVINIFGFSALSDANSEKTRVFCLIEVEMCDWITKNWIVSWFGRVIEMMYSQISRSN